MCFKEFIHFHLMNILNNEKSLLYKACLALEWTLLLYICVVPFHVYFYPEMWAVQVVDQYGEEPVYTEPRLFVESRRLPQVTNVDDWRAPVNTNSFYFLTLGYVFVKIGRITPRVAISNVQRKFTKMQTFLEEGF